MADVIPGDWVSVRKLAEIEGAEVYMQGLLKGEALQAVAGESVAYDAKHDAYVSPSGAVLLREHIQEIARRNAQAAIQPQHEAVEEPTPEAEAEPKMSAADSARRRRQRGRVPGMD